MDDVRERANEREGERAGLIGPPRAMVEPDYCGCGDFGGCEHRRSTRKYKPRRRHGRKGV